MLSLDVRLCPNAAEVAAKIMDGEAIMINLSDGMYYSMDLAGALVWELIDKRCTLHEIAHALAARYEVDLRSAESDLQRLAQELIEANLVQVCADAAEVAHDDHAHAGAVRLTYRAPRLNAYDDMAELLALDPPHPLLTDTLANYPAKA